MEYTSYLAFRMSFYLGKMEYTSYPLIFAVVAF